MISIHSDRSWNIFLRPLIAVILRSAWISPNHLSLGRPTFPFPSSFASKDNVRNSIIFHFYYTATHSRFLRLTSVTMSLFWYKLFEFFFCSNTPDYSVTTFLGILFSKLSKTVVAHSDRVQVSLPCATRLLFRLFDNVISSEGVIILSAQDTTIGWQQFCANVAIGCFLSSAEERRTPADTVLCTRVSRRATLWLPPAFEPITDANSLAV